MAKTRVIVVAILFLLFVLPIVGGTPQGPPPGPAFVPGEILLKFRATSQLADKARLRADLGATTLHTFASSAEHWRIAANADIPKIVARLTADPSIAYAEPNYMLKLNVVPNDPRLGEMWGLINTGQSGGTADADIDAELAWGVSTGSSDVIVADIDTGIDYNHPDLAANVWTNPGEIPGNGIDDDGNGYVDDVHGYDFVNNDGDPFDDHGHGTHTAGTIGAVGDNGIGVVGVNWHVKIMSCKFLDAGGSGSTANAVLAVDYATNMGAALSSNSWGGGGFSQTLYDAIARANAHNIAFVAAAGNGSANTDVSPNYPSGYDLPNIIAVAATDRNDQLASFSNWGPTTVDLAAPGVDILSTLPGNSYGLLSGTSMATPHVAGTCALIKAVNPNIPVGQMKSVLLNSVDHIASMNGKCVSNGRLNAFRSIAEPDTTAPGMINDLSTTDPGSNTMGLTWTATGDDGGVGTATYYEVRYSTSTITEANFASATRAGNEPTPLPAGSAESMEVRNLAASTSYFFAVKAFDEWGNAGPISNIAAGQTLPPPTGQVAPTSVSDDLLTGQESDHPVTLSNIGVGTLDFSIPSPALGQPQSAPAEPLYLGKDDLDPRHNGPIAENQGGPDTFGYRWVDSDQPGGPTFAWQDISSTGTPLGLTSDDQTSSPVALGFNFPLYGTLFNSIRVCTNGWLSFTSTLTSYSNQPLPNSAAPENLIAPFWDDLNPNGTNRTFFQSFGNHAIIQWQGIDHYSTTGTGTYSFQVILDSSGSITYQYQSMVGTLDSATIGIQDASKTVALQTAFNQPYVHNGLAVRISAIPQWLTASPTSGRLGPGASKIINLHMNANGLEGGTYPGTVNILTNDPANPILAVSASLHVIGAPDAAVQPSSLDYGTTFLGQPYTQTLIVANTGTDTLQVSDITSTDPSLSPAPRTFNVPPHGSQNVVVTWTPAALGAFAGTLSVLSNAAGSPHIDVPVTGNAVPTPVMLYTPAAFDETLFSGNTVTRSLTVTNTGGPDLVVNAAADLGGGQLVFADDVGINGAGGPDGFGYRWKDSDASGGPTFSFADISATGTTISFSSSDDALSAAIPMGMTFPFYGSNFTSVKVGTNGFLTFDTADTSTRLTNSTLPSSSGAKFMLALLWDDLHLRSGNVKYFNDGSRFIVQYTNVEKFSPSGFPMTFQVQLYPNGKILYEYKTMPTGGTYNSLTIGIQDGTKTVGLAADFNVNYVHANMAIQFSRTPDWLAVTPSHAVIPPGQHADFAVKFDSTDRLGGTLNGNVVLNTNVPSQAHVLVPAALHVIGAPIVAIVPSSYAYGTRFTGYAYPVNFQVVNNGTDVLNVGSVTSDDPALTVQEQSIDGDQFLPEAAFPLPPGGARLFQMSWNPTVPGPLNAHIHVQSDDPVSPDKTMAVTGVAIPPPIASWSPASFGEAALAGEVLHRTLHLQNGGGSDLNFDTLISLNSGVTVPVYPELKLGKDEVDPRPGILGAGGPDAFGYRWRDSDEPGGPAFGWVDITGIGTHLTTLNGDDQTVSGIPLGFNFPFYGTTFTSLNVCSNGFASFTSTATTLTNSALPSSGAPENMLAPFWDDLSFSSTHGSGQAYYYSDGNRFILSYINVPHYPTTGTGPYTFQIILYRSGRIVYQYLTMGVTLNSATIGIQNATKDDGLAVAFNAAYVHNAMAVEIRPPAGWLAVSPGSGTIPAGGSTDLDVAFDATDLIGGDYTGSIDMSTNDPAHASIQVPASLHVTGIPDVASTPGSLSYAMTYVGFSRTQTVDIQNVGTDVLHVTGVAVTGNFSQTGLTPPVALAPGGSIPVTVTFTPLSAGTLSGELRVTSDDPDEGTFSVPLQGTALIPPEIHATPTEIQSVLPPSSSTTRTLRIDNTGGSDLNWDSSTLILSGAPAAPYQPSDKGKDDPETGPGILGSGGPDGFGYRWRDSDEPGGPVFGWVDITGIGTPIGLNADDQNVPGIPIGFNFPFYGSSYSSLNACTNGWLSFTSTLTQYLNQPLPVTGTTNPENLLAVFWDDMDFRPASGSGQAFTYNDGSRFIVSYVNVPHYTGAGLTGLYTYQVILYPNGRIVYQYLSMSGTLNSATIGIQNAGRSDGLTVVYNDAYVHPGLAIEIKPIPRWVQVAPTSGTIPAGGSQDVTVTLDSTDLEHGLHDSQILLSSNDPYTPTDVVPVQLAVDVKPVAVAGSPAIAECTGNNHASAMLNGSGSHDADGDPLTYHWSAPGIAFDDPTSPTPTASFPLGSTVVTLVVNDGFQNSDPATVTVSVVDTMPPTVTSVSSVPNSLWPPNHQMSPVATTVTATDICDPNPTITLASVTSSEPDDAQGGGDGVTTNDIQDASVGTPDFQLLLRAERDGKGTGRNYTVSYRATDHSGNSSAVAGTTVNVPHDRGNVVEPVNLTVSSKTATRVSWGAVTGAQNYDVIRGNLANLRINGSNIDLGQVTCIAHQLLATSTAGLEDTAVPAPGQAFFYAVQYFDGIQKSSFGSESSGRASVIQPGNGGCP
jgi:subtilisin family serine protease